LAVSQGCCTAASRLESDNSQPVTLASGSRLGPYEILSPLGAGGMGEVYRARDTRLGRDVAVKVVHPKFASDDELLRRFELEARAASQLDHPNILVVHDVGSHEGSPYLVSELLEGESLRDVLEGPLPPKKAIDYAVQAAHGLAAAHEKGIVHRDLKPENLFITKDERVKILDFGLAKLVPLVGPSVSATEAPTGIPGTEPGIVMGTVGYMSPEQVRGLAIDHRSDIFSFGAILYEMLSGKRAFSRTTASDTMAAILRDEPSDLSQSGQNIPPALDHIVRHCLEKDRDNRFQSARDVAFDLSEASGLAGSSASEIVAPVIPARRNVLAPIASGVVVLLVLAVVLYSRLRTPAPAESARAGVSIAVLPFTNLSNDKEQEYFSDGLSEELIGLLGKVKELRVVGRTSSFAFKGKNVRIGDIGRELHVATLLEGSVRRAGGRLRVSTQLVSVADGYQIWADTYDRDVVDVFGVQDEIAIAVVAALKVRLLPEERPRASKRRTSNPEAYNQYLLGRYFFDRGNPENYRRSVEAYQKAVALDPGFAAAYAGLSISEALEADIFVESSGRLAQARKTALAAAAEALALDPDLAEGYTARGYLRSTATWDWAGARMDLEHALSLAPANANTHTQYSTVLACLGRLPEAIKEARTATDLDPLSPEAWITLGSQLRVAGQFAEARKALNRAIEIVPNSDRAHSFLGSVSLLEGNPAAALQQFSGRDIREGSRLLGMALAEHDLGHPEESQRALKSLIAKYADTWAVQVADAYAWRGQTDEAFEWLDHAYAKRDGGLADLKFDPYLAKLRSDPRYESLLRKVGLPVP
jgi:serine/threonine protein kinase/tetratricopeptide (TPR) repeat protein